MKELEFFKLEDRVLFDAAAAADIVAAAEAAQNDPNADMSESDRQAQQEREAVKNAPPENPAAGVSGNVPADPADITDVNAEVDALIDGLIPSGTTGKELVVINSSVTDKAAIIDALHSGQEYLILSERNGLAELNAFLDQSGTVYSAIHLVTHGNDGYISVNGQIIDSGSFDAQAWQEIGEHLTEDGDILLYGCNTAAGTEGRELIGMIADASGADVAASTDTTGISGNWDLEYSAGVVETGEIEADDFTGNLTTYTVDTYTDTVDSGDNATSLREAITQANSNAGSEIIFDTSTWGSNTTITLDSHQLEIAADVTITGDADTRITITTADDLIRIFNAEVDNDISISISYLDLDGGDGLSDTSSIWSGGAIHINSGFGSADLTLDHVNITDSRGQDGGAVFINADSNAKLTLKNVSISNCQAVYGGAVAITTGTGNISLDIVNSTLYGNSAITHSMGSGDGGAVYVNAGNAFTINVVDSTITGNCDAHSGGYGGGIFAKAANAADASPSSLNILNSIVYGNYQLDDSNAVVDSSIYVSGDTKVNVVHSVYDKVIDGNLDEYLSEKPDSTYDGPLFTNSTGSIAGSSVSLSDIFASTVTDSNGATVAGFSDGTVAVNNQNIAGYGGVKTAYTNGGYLYDAGNGNWKDMSGNSVSSPANDNIISTDQVGNDRTLANTYFGVNEYFIGAVAGKIYLEVKPADIPEVKYNGQTHSTTVTYHTANTDLDTSRITAVLNVIAPETSGKDVVAGGYAVKASGLTASYNGQDVTGDFDVEYLEGNITVVARDVTMTSGTAEKIYDGSALTDSSIAVGGDGFVNGEGAAFNVTGSQTDAGSSSNTFDYTLDSNTLAVNYNITRTEGTLTVTPKDVTVQYVTNEPYYYNGTDQKDSVTAYYTDVNNNQIPLVIDWGGKSFTEPGSYTITVSINDGNYRAVNTSFTVVMNSTGIGGGEYSDGLNPQYSGIIPAMQGDLNANGTGGDNPYGNFYTMNYSELVYHTMLRHNPGRGGEVNIITGSQELTGTGESVSLDTLKFMPMTPDRMIRESSVFPADPPADALYVDGENPLTGFWSSLPGLEAVPEKVEAFKDDLEKLLEEFILA
ncbi:MAG: DUF4347 domain-containing protein [Lentisphaeria bacterium]|nr:DUF4347 domain-containing protein [Lentisphaeria bacterium]